jgi:hypothetical protein
MISLERKRVEKMTSAQMYELARRAVLEYAGEDPDGSAPDVLWVGGVLEDRRAVVWHLGKLYMVRYDTRSGTTTVDAYIRAE